MHDSYATVPQSPDDPRPPVVDLPPPDHPEQIGRYRIERVLGEGGFGLVYLAHDDQLRRAVAIKVPRPGRLSRPEDAEEYLAEARTVAGLDHPNIVPIFDVGTTPDGLCYVVSKVIDGSDLAKKIRQARPSYSETAGLIATVAEALHYAHRKGLVHRDIKPANILLDADDRPYVADFGLALRDEDFGKGAGFAGTPAYMSPEQARGEGHRVDGRSDLFSLGVVFYELLVGRRPFRADSLDELLEQVTKDDARPPRQLDDNVPKELERICLKALSKRASERYTTAKDMADDLRHFLGSASVVGKSTTSFEPVDGGAAPTPVPTPVPTPASDSRPLKIVPKGLRSFDAHDADFFLELLPGPRDRDGLPDSLRFWKIRIEATDPDDTFSVGLIYGPSGCGKSSLVKAGLLPRLARHMIAVYVEATADETEARLLRGLRKHCPDVPESIGVIETLAALRRGKYLPAGKKVVIVLDQFEQWLHAKKEKRNAELVQALRQCDGGRVQCIVMVRDDFWLAVSRFLRELEIRLLEGQNSALADLFDMDHARKVLAAFGRAFGKLPEISGDTSKEQKEFLDQAVSGLAQEGKVISVRLALFAEMMKGKSWKPATLKEVGGTEGVGITFLEEMFSAATAPPEHRYHQKAARGILKVLLPESGTDIKGHMRSHGELLEASGYGSRPKDFDDLIRILDGEIRLITPTDPEGKAGAEEFTSQAQTGQKYYQLTHDYLVPSLREWLTRKQKETRRGRAELLLADRAEVWNARPENRQLPSLVQWLQIRRLTVKKDWKPPQRRMMGRATRYHVVRGAGIVLLAVATFTGLAIREQVIEHRKATQADGLVRAILNAETAQVPAIIREMGEYRKWTDPLLREEMAKAANARQTLHSSLALLPVDTTQVEYLYGRLLDAEPHEVPIIRDALAPHKDELLDRLWAVAETPDKGKESQRLRAAAALAKYDPEGEKWAKANALVVNDLVLENAVFLGQWGEAFRPVKVRLMSPLSVIFRDHRPEKAAERSLATNLLADYAADDPKVLAELVMEADEKQFAVIYPKFEARGERGLPVLIGEIDRKLSPDSKDEAKEKLAKRQAKAAVVLLRMKQSKKVWPLLKHSSDPRAKSYLIHWLSPLGADAGAIVERLKEESDVTIRRALLLSLGEFGEADLSPEARKAMLPKVREMYRTEADPGLHASAEWLLRSWKQDAWLKKTNDAWAEDGEGRDKKIAGIKDLVRKDKGKTQPQWYVNAQGQTFVVVPGPVEFLMGSPKDEKDRSENEVRHKRRIGRSFEIASKSVTLEQYRRLTKDKYEIGEKFTHSPDLPVVGISWYMAANYCNLLSKEEGIDEEQWCYETDGKGAVTKLKESYLSLTGYRLPTEAEMEYATRAGAETSRYYGETEELLGNYAWYLKNSGDRLQRGGLKKPNDFGLFDVEGNCFTWCQEAIGAYPKAVGERAVEDKEVPKDNLVVKSIFGRVLRGSVIVDQPSLVRSARRLDNVPTNRNIFLGFRPARTFTP